MTDAEARRAVMADFRSSPVTRPLLWEAEKVVRPVMGRASGTAFDEAVVEEAGLADLYRREVERRKRKVRR